MGTAIKDMTMRRQKQCRRAEASEDVRRRTRRRVDAPAEAQRQEDDSAGSVCVHVVTVPARADVSKDDCAHAVRFPAYALEDSEASVDDSAKCSRVNELARAEALQEDNV